MGHTGIFQMAELKEPRAEQQSCAQCFARALHHGRNQSRRKQAPLR